jgi:hypothetical protein
MTPGRRRKVAASVATVAVFAAGVALVTWLVSAGAPTVGFLVTLVWVWPTWAVWGMGEPRGPYTY